MLQRVYIHLISSLAYFIVDTETIEDSKKHFY